MDDVKSGEMLHVVHGIYNFRKADLVFEWLVKNHFTGSILLRWFKTTWNNSVFELVKFVLGKIEKEIKTEVLYGKDWVGR
jgi:hypothetical protein